MCRHWQDLWIVPGATAAALWVQQGPFRSRACSNPFHLTAWQDPCADTDLLQPCQRHRAQLWASFFRMVEPHLLPLQACLCLRGWASSVAQMNQAGLPNNSCADHPPRLHPWLTCRRRMVCNMLRHSACLSSLPVCSKASGQPAACQSGSKMKALGSVLSHKHELLLLNVQEKLALQSCCASCLAGTALGRFWP